jgi:hypothetical protein
VKKLKYRIHEVSCNTTNVRALLTENRGSLVWAYVVHLSFLIQTEPSIGASHQCSVHLAKQFQRRRLLEIGQSETRIVCGDHVCQRIGMKKVNDIGSDHWASIFSEQSTNICRITTCNERCINRVHITFSLYTTNCQNRPCGKEFNTTAFVNLLICNVATVANTWFFFMLFVALTSRLVFNTLHSL